MTPTLSLTEDQIFDALGDFLDSVLPEGVTSEKGQINRVPEPNADNFVIMTSQGSNMLATNETNWDTSTDNPTQITEMQSTELRIQLDVHGTNSSDNAQVIKTLFRSGYACDFFANIGLPLAPLYSSDGSRVPFINGENQWEDRWVLIVSLEVKPVISYAQDFMVSLNVDLVEVYTTFGPGPTPVPPTPPTPRVMLDFRNRSDSGYLAAFYLARALAPSQGMLDFRNRANSGYLAAFYLAQARAPSIGHARLPQSRG